MEGFLILFLILAFFGVVYFLPAILSFGSSQFRAVLLLNALLGWTIIGWILLLVRSLSPGFVQHLLSGNLPKAIGSGGLGEEYRRRSDNQPAGV